MMMQILQVCISHLRNRWHYSALFFSPFLFGCWFSFPFFFFSFPLLNRRGMLCNCPGGGEKNKAAPAKPRQSRQAPETPRDTLPIFFIFFFFQSSSEPETRACLNTKHKGKRNQTGYVIPGSNPTSFSKNSRQKLSLRGLNLERSAPRPRQ